MSKEDILLFSCYGMRGEGKSYYEKMKEKDKEIERLKNINEEHRILNGKLRVENSRSNNIINELEKWLEERLEKLDIYGYDDDVFNGIELALQKLEELKGKE